MEDASSTATTANEVHRRGASTCRETPVFRPGERVRVMERFPIGHYRVPLYLRGRTGVVERLVNPRSTMRRRVSG